MFKISSLFGFFKISADSTPWISSYLIKKYWNEDDIFTETVLIIEKLIKRDKLRGKITQIKEMLREATKNALSFNDSAIRASTPPLDGTVIKKYIYIYIFAASPTE